MQNFTKIYIHHYTKLTKRKEYLLETLKDVGVPIVWMDKYDRDKIDPALLERWFNKDCLEIRNRTIRYPGFNGCPQSGATLIEKCIAISHIMMYQDITENHSNDSGLFLSLEDDVLFADGWLEILNKVVSPSYVPPDWDILFPGNGCELTHLFGTDYLRNPQTRFAWHLRRHSKLGDTYILKHKTASKLWNNCQNGFYLPPDWELTYHISALNLVSYWLTPGINFQGSYTGTYEASVERSV